MRAPATSLAPLQSSTHRIAYIDGLRAVAVLGVLAYHTAYNNHGVDVHTSPSSPLMLFLRQGCRGVDLFFVISGFCLAYPTLQRLHCGRAATIDIAGYASRRLVRIIPPYYCAIGLLLALYFILPYFGFALPTPMMSHISWIGILRNALFLDGNGEYLAGPFWTLAIEFRWYFIFPIALWLWARSPRAFLTVLLFTILLGGTQADSLDLVILPGFMLGIIAADMHVRRVWFARLAWPALVPVASYAIAATASNWMNAPSLAWQVTAFLVVVAVGSSQASSKLLSLRCVTFFGIASYGIYLVHEPIVVLLEMHRVDPILAAFGALTAGVSFWAIAERPFVQGNLRSKLMAELSFLPRWFSQAGISNSLHLQVGTASGAPDLEIERDASIANKGGRHEFDRLFTS